MPSSSTIASTSSATSVTDPPRSGGECCPSRGAPWFRVHIGQKRAPGAEPRPHLAPAATGLDGADQVRRLGKKHFRVAGGCGDSHPAEERHCPGKDDKDKSGDDPDTAAGAAASDSPQVFRFREPVPENLRKFFFPRAMMFSSRARARLSTAATRLCESLPPRSRSRTWWSAARRRAYR